MTLSAYVRDLLLEAVLPVFEDGNEHGDQPPPESMRLIDRQVLSLLHRILGRVVPEDSNDTDGDLEYQLERAQILEEEYAGEYWLEVAGFSPSCPHETAAGCQTSCKCSRVITCSIEHLAQEWVLVLVLARIS
ncbi:MAG TPA: YfbU family protein [Pseudonocardiaceae bacterium]